MMSKHQPLLKRVQVGVQMRFTIGQNPSQPSAAPAAKPMIPAIASHLTLADGARSLLSTPPAIKPSIIVPSVGMKLNVAYPPSLKTNFVSRGNRFRNHVSKAQARLLFLFQCA